jgi:hypothetical protein
MNMSLVENGIDIVVRASEDALVKVWLSYNSEWINSLEAQIWRCSPASSGGLSVTPFGESFCEEAGPQSSGRPLLYVSADWVLRHDWLSHIAAAYALRPFMSATGRLVIQAAGARADLVDQTPHRIAEDIKEWFFAPEMHGLVAHKLPDDVLWVSPDARPLFLATLTFEDEFEGAASRFYGSLASDVTPGIHVYLPDAIAVRISQ